VEKPRAVSVVFPVFRARGRRGGGEKALLLGRELAGKGWRATVRGPASGLSALALAFLGPSILSNVTL